MQFEEFDSFCAKLCRETEKVILRFYEDPDLEVIRKSDDTPVTAADRQSETMIREAIETLYPDHGIMGEEYGQTNAASDFQWVIDPIDGTKTFAAACPLFGTMIALLHDGEPIYGCINYPALGKRLSGDGRAAFSNSKRIRARTGIPLGQAVVLTTDLQNIDRYQNRPAFDELLRQTSFCRTWGDCYGYSLVACGKAEIMLDPILNPWDIMALIPILRGSGAVITDWRGGNPAKGTSCVAANADLHQAVLDALNA